MSARINANIVVVLLAGALVLPGLASADSGGVSPFGTGSNAGHGAGGPLGAATVQPGDVTASATAGGVTLSARVSALLSHRLRFAGAVPVGSAGDPVIVQRLDRHAGWVRAAATTAAADGSFGAVWRTDRTGRFAMRVVVQRPGRALPRAATTGPTLHVTVYRPAIATQYGQGFYGQSTACGQTLQPRMLGVAHRSLPCGTQVAIYYRGRTIVVPVIDRGPYANNADWDVTEATGRALGMDGTQTLGAAPLTSTR